MKDYIIWLNSGETIQGTAELGTLESFVKTWQEGEMRIATLWDSNGRATINMSAIQAIAINNIDSNKPIGFNTEA